MTSERHTTIVDVDISRALPQWEKLDRSIDASGGSAQRLADGMRVAEVAGLAVADTATKIATAQDKIASATGDSVAATKAAAASRSIEADVIEHEVRLLKAMGAAQGDILDAQRLALDMRAASAAMLGDEASVQAHAREGELIAVKHLQAEQRAATAARADGQRKALVSQKAYIGTLEEAVALAEHQVRLSEALGKNETQLAELYRVQLAAKMKLHAATKDTAKATQATRDEEVRSADAASRHGDMIGKLPGYWQEAIVAVYAMVSALQLADAAMERAFTEDAITQNLKFPIDDAREATLGLVDDMELSRQAIAANRLQLTTSAEDYAALSAAAVKLGVSSGQTASEGLSAVIEGLGRGSTEMLDNVGVTIRAAEAQAIYAEQIGISVKSLTDAQKTEAIKVVGTQRVIEAASKVTLAVTEQEQAWIRARQQYDKLSREALPEATSRMGGLWVALEDGGKLLEDISPQVLGYLDSIAKGLAIPLRVAGFFADQIVWLAEAANTVGGHLGRAADRAGEFKDVIVDWLDDGIAGRAADWVSDTGAAIVAFGEDAIGGSSEAVEEQIPLVDRLAESWLGVAGAQKETAAGIPSLIAKAKDAYKSLLELPKQYAREQAAAEASTLANFEQQTVLADHQIKLAVAQQAPASELERLYRAQYGAKLRLLSATGDIAGIEAAQRDEEVRKATRGRGGGGKRVTDAERMAAAGEIQITQWQDRLALEQAEAELRGTADAQAEEFAWVAFGIAEQELDLERKVLEITKGKSAIERENNAARIEAIAGEQQLLRIQKDIAEQEFARERSRTASEESLAARDREIELVRAEGAAVQMLEAQRRVAHMSHLREFGESQEILDAQAAEQVRQVEAEQEKAVHDRSRALEAFEFESEIEAARGIMVRDEAEQRMQLQLEVAAAEGDHDAMRQIHHDAEVARIKGRFDVQKRISDASSKLLTGGASLFSAVAEATIKDEAKRERAVLRARGVEAVARGALETVESVASFARFDFVGGALHAAGAVTAFATGLPMIAGRVPNGGGGAAAGGGGGQAVGYEGSANEGPGQASTPASAEELTRLRGGFSDKAANGSGSGNVYINNSGSTNVANDTGQLFGDLQDRKQKKAWG